MFEVSSSQSHVLTHVFDLSPRLARIRPYAIRSSCCCSVRSSSTLAFGGHDYNPTEPAIARRQPILRNTFYIWGDSDIFPVGLAAGTEEFVEQRNHSGREISIGVEGKGYNMGAPLPGLPACLLACPGHNSVMMSTCGVLGGRRGEACTL